MGKHYLQLTDEHFEQATDEKSAAQNAAQSMHAKACHNTPEGTADRQHDTNVKSRNVAPGNGLRPLAFSGCNSLCGNDLGRMPPVGLEPTTR